jgi:putative CocE/NonD family hydrolase
LPENNVFISMPDGVRLAATLYLPETTGPWPALLEAYPYRKDDLSVWPREYRRFRDEGDYAVCRLDVRGTGTSEGVAVGEYPPTEVEDLAEVIAWLAKQDWCTGSVGMYGSSYSGFNTIQTAMQQPPALKAIVPIYATDDRYTDDIHFGGGVRKAIEFGYPLFMVSMNALPPVPSLAGDDWRDRWIRRIDELVPWFGSIEEQNDGPFWRQGSLRPDYDRIAVPTMLVAGWTDVYRTAMLRTYEHLNVPKRLLMGPWCHMLPPDSIPGPRIDLVPEMIRWWDRWLRGVDNGVDREPPITVYIQRSATPEPDLAEVPGEWRFETEWPPARRRDLVLELTSAKGADQTLLVRGDVGTTAHIRGSYPPPYGLPLDQRPDEVHSLVFDWPVEEELEILGSPVLEARVRSTVPVVYLSAKLCEVLPDGTSMLVSRGLLNLAHRDSDTDPSPLEPGRAVDVAVELDATSRVFEPGNRMRLMIAGADWPNGWPPPEASELTVELDGTRLTLPQMVGPSPVAERPSLVPVDGDAATSDATWTIERDVYGRRTMVTVRDVSEFSPKDDCRVRRTDEVVAGVTSLTPGDAWVESTSDAEIAWPEVTARARARLELRSDASTYRFDLTLDVFEGGEQIATRRWEQVVPRNLQ